MSFPQPTKSRVKSLYINNVDFTAHVNQLRVYETIQKPYITAKVTVIDNNNVLDNMGLVGGEPVDFSFDGGEASQSYDANLHVLKIKGQKSNESLRAQIYDIECIGPSYFNDKKNLVQQAFKFIPGTQAIQSIHSQYVGTDAPLRILAQSIGPLSLQSYIVSAQKPFKAINDIKKRLNFAGFQTGNCLYFRDAQSYVLAPLEALFANLNAQQTFYQEATWGKNWFDVVRAQNAIISAVADCDYNDSGRSSMTDIADKVSQEKKVFDFRIKDLAVNKAAGIPGIGAVVGSALSIGAAILGGGGSHGGRPNYSVMDSAHLPAQQDPSAKSEAEQLYSALVKNGPGITVKVPIQSGIQCTVGKGADLKLLPPVGDVNEIGPNMASGMYLITDLMHYLCSDDRQMTGVTIFQAARGGLG
jgi:hypothetical protein